MGRLILAGSELNTVGPATENARRANSVYGRAARTAEKRRQSASVWPALRHVLVATATPVG